MDKQDFKDAMRVRREEFEEMEEMVQRFAKKIKRLQPLLRGASISAYREGMSDLLQWFDQKAINIKEAKEATQKLLEQTRGC